MAVLKVCAHCGDQCTRYVTKGPYCRIACWEAADDAKEIADLRKELAHQKELYEALEEIKTGWREDAENLREVLMYHAVIPPTAQDDDVYRCCLCGCRSHAPSIGQAGHESDCALSNDNAASRESCEEVKTVQPESQE